MCVPQHPIHSAKKSSIRQLRRRSQSYPKNLTSNEFVALHSFHWITGDLASGSLIQSLHWPRPVILLESIHSYIHPSIQPSVQRFLYPLYLSLLISFSFILFLYLTHFLFYFYHFLFFVFLHSPTTFIK